MAIDSYHMYIIPIDNEKSSHRFSLTKFMQLNVLEKSKEILIIWTVYLKQIEILIFVC